MGHCFSIGNHHSPESRASDIDFSAAWRFHYGSVFATRLTAYVGKSGVPIEWDIGDREGPEAPDWKRTERPPVVDRFSGY